MIGKTTPDNADDAPNQAGRTPFSSVALTTVVGISVLLSEMMLGCVQIAPQTAGQATPCWKLLPVTVIDPGLSG